MNRKVLGLSTIASLVLLAACNSAPHATSPLSPDVPQSQSVVYDSSVQWSADQLGKVTITNPRSTPLILTFVVWRYQGEFDQTAVASQTYTISPHATQVLTVGGIDLGCGLTFQRDLYEGKFTLPTLSDVGNYLYAAPGVLWKTPSCDQPPVVPPVDPCTKKVGVSNWHPPTTPPCPPDPCEVKKGQSNNFPPINPCIHPDAEGV